MTTSRKRQHWVNSDALITMVSLWVMLGALAAAAQALAVLPTVGVLVLALALTLPLSALLFSRQRLRRRALLAVYLARSSALQRWLQGGLWMYAGQLGLALGLSLLLLAGLARNGDTLFWLLLAALVPLWVLSYAPIAYAVAPHFNTDYRTLVTQRLHGGLWGGVLLLIMTGWALYQPVLNLTGASLEAVILQFTHTSLAKNSALQALIDAMAVVDGLRHWMAQNMSSDNVPFTLLIWLLVLAQEWLLVWPLLLLFQAMHRLSLDRVSRVPATQDEPHAPH